MYFPITFLYIYIANAKVNAKNDATALNALGVGGVPLTNVPGVTIEGTIIVLKNLLISELTFLLVSCLYTFPEESSIINIIYLLICQDVYFYTTHRLFHTKYLYQYHKIHHAALHPLYAWHASMIEHIIINIGSFAVSFMMFPNSSLVLTLLVGLQTYTSVDGHSGKTEHTLHHIDNNKRYGSIYIVDRILGTY